MESTVAIHNSRMKEDFVPREGLASNVDKSRHRQKVKAFSMQ
jgi:hypothetical protein